jgi:hypothetical protein
MTTMYTYQFRWSTPYQLNFFIHLYKIMAIFKEFMHCVNIPFHSQILHLFQFADEMSNSHKNIFHETYITQFQYHF